MARYRKLPVEIEAFKYNYNTEGHTISYPRWFMDAVLLGVLTEDDAGQLYIQTLEGKMHVADGDYIIEGVKGELYPCKPDIFTATYEFVTE